MLTMPISVSLVYTMLILPSIVATREGDAYLGSVQTLLARLRTVPEIVRAGITHRP
jgi:hypothetical protein